MRNPSRLGVASAACYYLRNFSRKPLDDHLDTSHPHRGLVTSATQQQQCLARHRRTVARGPCQRRFYAFAGLQPARHAGRMAAGKAAGTGHGAGAPHPRRAGAARRLHGRAAAALQRRQPPVGRGHGQHPQPPALPQGRHHGRGHRADRHRLHQTLRSSAAPDAGRRGHGKAPGQPAARHVRHAGADDSPVEGLRHGRGRQRPAEPAGCAQHRAPGAGAHEVRALRSRPRCQRLGRLPRP